MTKRKDRHEKSIMRRRLMTRTPEPAYLSKSIKQNKSKVVQTRRNKSTKILARRRKTSVFRNWFAFIFLFSLICEFFIFITTCYLDFLENFIV